MARKVARRCLIVEDDPSIAEMYRIHLQQEGWEVLVAGDGETGLRSALVDPPSVVVLDIVLPGLDGFGVLEGIRADPRTRELPVIVVSNSRDGADNAEHAQRLGVIDWLVKNTTTPADLSRRLDQLLEAA